jgi:hypothetical protein
MGGYGKSTRTGIQTPYRPSPERVAIPTESSFPHISATTCPQSSIKCTLSDVGHIVQYNMVKEN